MQDSTRRDDCSVTPLPTEPMTPGGPHFAEVDAEGCIDEGRGGIPNPSHLDQSPEADTALDSDPERNVLNANVDLNMLSEKAQLNEMKTTLAFIEALRIASLNDPCANLDNNVLRRLQNPPMEPVDISDNDILTGLDLFLGTINFPQDAYINSREVMTH